MLSRLALLPTTDTKFFLPDSGSLLGFDVDMVSCMWLDDKAHEFNVFLVVVAIFLPLIATMYFYVEIFR